MAPKSTERTVRYDDGKAVLCSDIHQRAPMNKTREYRSRLARVASIEKNKKLSDNQIAAAIKGQDDFLKTEEWFKLKAATIAKYGWTCMKCKREIKIWSRINVDHIKPRRYWPELKNDPDNLQILCGPCNKEKGNSVADYR